LREEQDWYINKILSLMMLERNQNEHDEYDIMVLLELYFYSFQIDINQVHYVYQMVMNIDEFEHDDHVIH
jgi:hypothetical protein